MTASPRCRKHGPAANNLHDIGGWAFDSAGGFSTGAPQPEWQVKAIEAYNEKHTSDVFGFLQGNAGVPDLSAQVRFSKTSSARLIYNLTTGKRVCYRYYPQRRPGLVRLRRNERFDTGRKSPSSCPRGC